ncbi:hypothetical protein D3C75_975890 [compost metagenome]
MDIFHSSQAGFFVRPQKVKAPFPVVSLFQQPEKKIISGDTLRYGIAFAFGGHHDPRSVGSDQIRFGNNGLQQLIRLADDGDLRISGDQVKQPGLLLPDVFR